jgi:hypothetical protein
VTWTNPNQPNITDYTDFLYGVVGIPTENLPNTAPIIQITLTISLEIVNVVLSVGSCQLYTLAVYNLAADRLITYAPDVPAQTYFQDLRNKLNISSFTPGVPSEVADQGTSVGLLNPDFLKAMTIGDLQTLKTFYGRQYMAFAQDYGPAIWGVT